MLLGGIAETNGRPCVSRVLKGICRAVYCDAYQQGKVCLITAARLLWCYFRIPSLKFCVKCTATMVHSGNQCY